MNRLNAILIIFVLTVATIVVVPNVFEIKGWPSKDKISYGLDIQGGVHMVIGVDMEETLARASVKVGAEIQQDLDFISKASLV